MIFVEKWAIDIKAGISSQQGKTIAILGGQFSDVWNFPMPLQDVFSWSYLLNVRSDPISSVTMTTKTKQKRTPLSISKHS